jgi:hypothetical protein
MDSRIDYSRFTGGAESAEVSRQQQPQQQLRPQLEIERNPTYFQKQQERAREDSSWAGSSMGGGTWAGRSR